MAMMNALTDVVKDLVINQQVPHRKIVQHVQKVVLDIGRELPKVRVLYCDSYGGYGLSMKFTKFVHDTTGGVEEHWKHSNDERVNLVKYIAPFGSHIMDSYKMLRRVVMLYTHYDLSTLVSCARYVHTYTSDIQKLEKDMKTIQTYIENAGCQGDKVYTKQQLKDVSFMYYRIEEGYTADAYTTFYNTMLHQVEMQKKRQQEKKEELRRSYKGSPEAWVVLYDDVERIVFLLKQDDKTFAEVERNRKRRDFIKEVDVQGDSDSSVWSLKFQSKYDELGMRYLYIKYGEGDGEGNVETEEPGSRKVYDFLVTKKEIDVSEDTYAKMAERVGLLCASTKYCDLKIDEVQQYVDWHIDEYDGKEKIVYY
jgi:hypothetical protein